MTLHFLEFYSVDKAIGLLECRTHDVGRRDLRSKIVEARQTSNVATAMTMLIRGRNVFS